MVSWERVHFLNRFLGGTIPPRVQLDLLPALMCAAHLLVRPNLTPTQLNDWICLGAAWQRIWLTGTLHGLHMQPEMTPVIFRWYARSGKSFSADPTLFDQSVELSTAFERLTGTTTFDPFGVFCRVGNAATPRSRSIRKGLQDLMR